MTPCRAARILRAITSGCWSPRRSWSSIRCWRSPTSSWVPACWAERSPTYPSDVIGGRRLLSPLVVLLLLLAAWGWRIAHAGIRARSPAHRSRVRRSADPATRGVSAPATSGRRRRHDHPAHRPSSSTPPAADATHRRWWWLAGYVAAAFLLAAFSASSTALPFDPTALSSSRAAGRTLSGSAEQGRPTEPVGGDEPLQQHPQRHLATDSYNLISPKGR